MPVLDALKGSETIQFGAKDGRCSDPWMPFFNVKLPSDGGTGLRHRLGRTMERESLERKRRSWARLSEREASTPAKRSTCPLSICSITKGTRCFAQQHPAPFHQGGDRASLRWKARRASSLQPHLGRNERETPSGAHRKYQETQNTVRRYTGSTLAGTVRRHRQPKRIRPEWSKNTGQLEVQSDDPAGWLTQNFEGCPQGVVEAPPLDRTGARHHRDKPPVRTSGLVSRRKDAGGKLLLNLGRKEARDWCVEFVSR